MNLSKMLTALIAIFLFLPVISNAQLTQEELQNLVKADSVQIERINNTLYVAAPLSDLWAKGYEREAFEASQRYAKMVVRDWLIKLATYEGNFELRQQLEELTPEEIETQLSSELTLRVPTPAEIVAEHEQALEVNERFEALAEINVEIDRLLKVYNKVEFLTDSKEADASATRAMFPDGWISFVTVKLPEAGLKWLQSVPRIGAFLAGLGKGSVTIAVFDRPWKVESYNMQTGEVITDDWFHQTSVKLMYTKDIAKEARFSPGLVVRAGVGAFYANDKDLDKYWGPYVGGSMDMGKAVVGGVPLKFNARYGTLVHEPVRNIIMANSFDEAFSVESFLNGGYLMLGWQTENTPSLRASRGNVGAFINLQTFYEILPNDTEAKVGKDFIKDEVKEPVEPPTSKKKKKEDSSEKDSQDNDSGDSIELPVIDG